jgi:maleate isomerase
MARDVAASRPDAIAIICTNFRGAAQAAALEAELGIPILDSVATGLWAGLRQAGLPTEPFARHGSLFRLA